MDFAFSTSPNDVTQCQELLLAAYRQSVELEQQAVEARQHAAEAEQRATESEQQVAELSRVLDETATSHQELQQEHAATLDELPWYNVGLLAEDASDLPKTKGRAICSIWTYL